ncbi:MAG: hypothetical protein ABII76_27415 [Pseudomonadota bacterium]
MDPVSIITAAVTAIATLFGLWERYQNRKLAKGLKVVVKAVEDGKTQEGLPGVAITTNILNAGKEDADAVRLARRMIAKRASV